MAEVTRLPNHADILAKSNTCENHIMQVGSNAYSCQFHPEVCEHTFLNWLKIPGIPAVLEEQLGYDGLNHFKSNIIEHLPSQNATALSLFENWNKLVFDERT